MNRQNVLFAVVFFMFMASFADAAREDTAHLQFNKQSISKQATHGYVVQKGDVISVIIRNLPGFTEENIKEYYRLVRELNPRMKNMQKIMPGQIIVLPGEASAEHQGVKSARDKSKIQEGRSEGRGIGKGMNETAGAEKPGAGEKGKTEAGERQMRAKEKEEPPLEKTLDVIKHIVTEMGVSFTASGLYNMTNNESMRLTFDSAKLPVIKFADGMTVFLDLAGFANDELKSVIHENWKNYHLVSVNKNDNYIDILNKVFSRGGVYSIAKSNQPVNIGKTPDVEVMVEWLIFQKDGENQRRPVQGLRIVDPDNHVLPGAIIDYARKSGLVITEISLANGVVERAPQNYSVPEIPAFSISSVKDFSYDLITALGFHAVKNVEIKIYDSESHRFDFSITADMILKKDEKSYVVFCRAIKPQYVNVLEAKGHFVINVSDKDSPATAMEKILRRFGYLFTSGRFTFSGEDRGQAPFHIDVNGVKIKADRDLYIINFEMDPVLNGMLSELWAAQFMTIGGRP
jgi:hypothetical protein